MAQYIDKAAIVAEIERRIKAYQKNFDRADNKTAKLSTDGRIQGLKSFLSFLDTIEVKEVNDDKWLIKATEWLSANLHRYDEGIGLSVEEFVERFKKAMGRI